MGLVIDTVPIARDTVKLQKATIQSSRPAAFPTILSQTPSIINCNSDRKYLTSVELTRRARLKTHMSAKDTDERNCASLESHKHSDSIPHLS